MTRSILRIGGTDRVKFLHGLLTRDVPEARLGYAALLSPQGKYLVDFLTWQDEHATYLDVAEGATKALTQRLGMYRLRADVTIEPTDMVVTRGVGPAPDGAMEDPRPGMGWRRYGSADDGGLDQDGVDWDAVRVANMVPETGVELVPNESYILEMGFERLGGVDFKKGCYVGQEVTARMKHKTSLRKGLARVRISGVAETGREITSGGKPVGVLHTVAGGRGLAYLRFDRARDMVAGDAVLTLDDD